MLKRGSPLPKAEKSTVAQKMASPCPNAVQAPVLSGREPGVLKAAEDLGFHKLLRRPPEKSQGPGVPKGGEAPVLKETKNLPQK